MESPYAPPVAEALGGDTDSLRFEGFRLLVRLGWWTLCASIVRDIWEYRSVGSVDLLGFPTVPTLIIAASVVTQMLLVASMRWLLLRFMLRKARSGGWFEGVLLPITPLILYGMVKTVEAEIVLLVSRGSLAIEIGTVVVLMFMLSPSRLIAYVVKAK